MNIVPQSVAAFTDKQEHLRVLSLTLPMIVANLTTPLLGLVDTAVLGHMPGPHLLAGAAIGTLIVTQIYWICGFIRMSATGLSAQAKGKASSADALKVLVQNALLALSIAFVMLVFQFPILKLGLLLADAQANLHASTVDYFSVRIWGAPAALVNLALIGWMLGQQMARTVMLVQIAANLLNAALDLLFVFVFDWGVAGVAAASVVAEYTILAGSVLAIRPRFAAIQIQRTWLKLTALVGVVTFNSHMLVRNLLLQLCLAFVTYQGARLGVLTAATNAILMQFFVLIALGLDAVAYAIEALVGEAKGARNERRGVLIILRGVFWSSVFAIGYALLFVFGGPQIIGWLTDQSALAANATTYLPIVILLPLVAHWCFLFDGVYVGLTEARIMRNSMLVSTLLVFFPVWAVTQSFHNWGLWIALLSLMAARGVTLAAHLIYRISKGAVLG